ncbi:MAG: sigma-70 family RNA polymerase sigma factor, partial [Planctomycetota bacterium]
ALMMIDLSDDTLIRDLVAGREDAFAALYDRFASKLFKAAWSVLGTREDAEDAVQDVFVGLVQTRKTLGNVRNLNAYLFTALYRATMKRATRKKNERKLVTEMAQLPRPTTSSPPISEESERLQCALQSLPIEQREVVMLKVDGGLTFEEIAASLNLSVSTAASRYRYALSKLRSALTGRAE